MTPARRLWRAIEPIHAVGYFHDDATAALTDLGARGFWMSYFAGRFGVLGPVGPDPVVAMAYGFSPALVRRALPDAWDHVDPAEAVAARARACARILREAIDDEAAAAELADALAEVAAGCAFDGRPLAAAWAAVEPGDDPYERLWLATTVLREHRGDGHVLAAVAAGLTGLEAGLTHVATGATTRALLQRSRAWTDGEWDAAGGRLRARGVLDDVGNLTPAGAALRDGIEARTDELAAVAPVEVVERAEALRALVLGTGVIPVPNPIGLD